MGGGGIFPDFFLLLLLLLHDVLLVTDAADDTITIVIVMVGRGEEDGTVTLGNRWCQEVAELVSQLIHHGIGYGHKTTADLRSGQDGVQSCVSWKHKR